MRSMSCGLVMLGVVSTCAVGAAQKIGVTHITPTGWSSRISVWPSSNTQRVPPKTPLMPTFYGVHKYFGASGTLDTKTTSSAGRVQMQLKCLTAGSVSRGGSVSIGGDSLLTLTSTTPLAAIVRVTLDVKQSGAITAIGSAGVTIPGHGTFSVNSGTRASKSFRVTIDSNGLGLTSTARWFSVGMFFSSSASIDIDVQALSVSAVSYGKTCAPSGPSLSASPQLGGELDLHLTSKAPNTLAGRLVGTRRLSLKIPGTSCWLNTDYVLVLPFMTDAKGEHRVRWPIPANVQFNVQDILAQKTTSGARLLTTNGVAISRR